MPLPQSVEVLNPSVRRGKFAVAVFDFDGTVSLIREGWAKIMAELGRDLIRDAGLLHDPESELLEVLEDRVLRLSGKPSIFQMHQLAEELARRGGSPPASEVLLDQFLQRLFAISTGRCDALRAGTDAPEKWSVPDTHAILDRLVEREVALYLVSGTDRQSVVAEAALLGLTHYFGDRVYAPDGYSPNFSKRDAFDEILARGVPGEQILSFGDGFAETVEAKRAGGVAVGIASKEAGDLGVNAMKRKMLAELGADVVVPHYCPADELLAWLFADA